MVATTYIWSRPIFRAHPVVEDTLINEDNLKIRRTGGNMLCSGVCPWACVEPSVDWLTTIACSLRSRPPWEVEDEDYRRPCYEVWRVLKIHPRRLYLYSLMGCPHWGIEKRSCIWGKSWVYRESSRPVTRSHRIGALSRMRQEGNGIKVGFLGK